MTLIEKIRELIADGETEQSLEELYDYVREHHADIIDTLVMLRNRLRGIEDEIIKGTMDQQTASLERAKINDAILKLLPQLTPEYAAKSAKWNQPSTAAAVVPTQKNNTSPLLVGGLLGAALLLFFLFRFVMANDNPPSADLPEGGDTTEITKPTAVDTSKQVEVDTTAASTPLAVSGQQVSRVLYKGYQQGQFIQATDGNWLEFIGSSETAHARFTEGKREEQSVFLLKADGSRLQLDLQQKKVRYEGKDLYDISATFDEVNGRNALYVAYDGTQKGYFKRTQTNSWVEYLEDDPFPDATYQEDHRDQWSVYLRQADGGIIQLNLYRKQVLFNGKELYRIYEMKRSL